MDVRPAQNLPDCHRTPPPLPRTTTGMRRGELAGLRWGDWNRTTHSISVARARQSVGGRSTEVPCKRGTVVDASTSTRKPKPSSRTSGAASSATGTLSGWTMRSSPNTQGRAVHPESISQLFTRQLARIDLPPIRFHDLRHTHASLLAWVEHADQGRVRTARPRPSRLHHGHLPARHARHERHRRLQFRPHTFDAT